MQDALRISARQAGAFCLDSYCPRCAYYLLKAKQKRPFEFPMPGVMHDMEYLQKLHINSHMAEFGKAPDYLGPFKDCVAPIEFPSSMSALHKPTGITLTARPDMILRRPNGEGCLIDLKTSNPNGGGKYFHPQYEMQVIGYSWVTNQSEVAKITSGGLIFSCVEKERFTADPSKFRSEQGYLAPMVMGVHGVELDYERMDEVLADVKEIWVLSEPPDGKQGCKDCLVLERLFEIFGLGSCSDELLRLVPERRENSIAQAYWNSRGLPTIGELRWSEDGLVSAWESEIDG